MSWDNENYRVLLGCKDVKPYLALMEYPYGDEWEQEYSTTRYIKEIEQLGVSDVLNGKILVECDIEICDIHCGSDFKYTTNCMWGFLNEEDLLKKSCLSIEQLDNYLRTNKSSGYAIHLKNIDILEKPRDVSECDQYRRPALHLKHLPRNMCDCYNYYGWWNILITLTPQEMCNVLNGKQTIIVRKEILEDRLKRLLESRWRKDDE